MMTTKEPTPIIGPYAEARDWLLRYMDGARFTNAQMKLALVSDWSNLPRERAAYILGTIWGRLRQADNSLETATEYGQLVTAEFETETAPDPLYYTSGKNQKE